jgi:hypothetical protein
MVRVEGHALEIQGGNEMGVHGVGPGRRQVQLPHLLPHIPRDERNGCLHFGHHALRFLDAIQARLVEPFLLSHGADYVDVLLDIPGNELAVSPHAALQVDKVVGVADGADALGELLTLAGEPLGLLASCVHFLLDLFQARRRLWGMPWTTLCRLAVGVIEVLVHPRERLFRLRGGLVGGTLFGGQWGRDGFAQLMLHMEDVRRVMRPKAMGNIRQKSRRLITRRLHDLTVEPRKSLLHQRIPRVVIARLRRLLQQNIVAHRLYTHQRQTTGKGFILRQRDVFGWHLMSQTRTLFVAVRHYGFFHATVDLLLRAVRGADKSIETRYPQEQTRQANPTGTHFGIHQVERHNQLMQEGETRNTVKKRHDNGALIEALLVRPPRLQRAAGNVQHLGRLTLREEALGVQVTILRKQLSTFDAIPALVTLIIATLLILDYRAHSSLLLKPLSWEKCMAKDGEGDLFVQPSILSSH